MRRGELPLVRYYGNISFRTKRNIEGGVMEVRKLGRLYAPRGIEPRPRARRERKKEYLAGWTPAPRRARTIFFQRASHPRGTTKGIHRMVHAFCW